MTLDRVIAWPVADPRQRIHLATEDWRIIGLTLCGEPIKGEAPDGEGIACLKCLAALAAES